MEGSDGSPPQSLCMIRAAELFPKQQMEKEDMQLTVPFQELAGESVRYLGRTDDGVLALSNYRIFLLKNSTNSKTSVPLGLIECAQTRDLFHLIVNCKDASTVKCSFETAEQCSEWQRRIQLSVGVPESLESLFAFPFCSWTCDYIANANAGAVEANGVANPSFANVEQHTTLYATDNSERLQRASRHEDDFMHEVERLGFDLKGPWRVSHVNGDFKLCPSYPQKILVPCCISDETLQAAANFRGSRRLPAVVWRHRKSGAVIARCSQPEVGWLGWRKAEDEQLLKALADACAFDRGEQMRRFTQAMAASAGGAATLPSESESITSSPDSSHEEVALDEVRKVLIVDARSYTSAVTNRARGGGCECIEYYPCAEIEFMNLGNIHVIRKSFHALRQLCASPPDALNWLSMLEKTMWFQHLSGLLTASVTVCHAIEKKGRPVLVHCSDGWDRTPQIVATAQLCLDPYYRTVEGFRILVEREWLSYGHKFADRCGHGPGLDDQNERCPVFLQWLDLVHQIHDQFTCSFEFSIGYLIKLAQHSLSCLFGTFLCNTLKERIENSVFERTFSVWPFLSGPMYRNPLYVANREKVLWPAHNVRDMTLWTEVYLGSLGNKNSADFSPCNADGLQGSTVPMAKTRSYGDFITSGIILNGLSRRSSDPNMTVEPNLTVNSNSENNSMADNQSEREDSPDFIANLIHDTTQKLQNLTTELKNHDENSFNPIRSETISHESEHNDNLEHQTPVPTSGTNTIGDSSPALQKLLHQKQQLNSSTLLKQLGNNTTDPEPGTLHSSPSPLTTNRNGCEINSTSSPAPSAPVSPATLVTDASPNDFKGYLNELNDIGKANSQKKSINYVGNEGNITVHTAKNMNLDLLQSVDLSEPITTSSVTPLCEEPVVKNGQSLLSNTEDNYNAWHGSVNTSTDTLVPIETKLITRNGDAMSAGNEYDDVDGTYERLDQRLPPLSSSAASVMTAVKEEAKPINTSFNKITQTQENCDILPKVHSRPNALSTSTTATTSISIPNGLNYKLNTTNSISSNSGVNINTDSNVSVARNTSDSMEESILILPEHQKLDISLSGECETIMNNVAFGTMTPTVASVGSPSTATAMSSTTATAFTATQRRRRTSSSHSRRDCFNSAKPVNESTTSKFSVPGVRSLPLTPPGLPERSQITISCPDGLAHALSEQNIRLQQIVHEHKMREDLLLREIHDMRMALLRKTCPNCNNALAANDEQCSASDNIENASICSWEAVEDRSGPSSSASSSVQPITSSVLWVPDHAVSRCTSCQIEFWLGRRKHHCRSCGQIFCADCSEFWAPLPDEKLFNPVRLCGPCYHSVTTRMQHQPQQFQRFKRNTCDSNTGNVATNALTLKTLSALALAKKTKAAMNAAAAAGTNIEINASVAETSPQTGSNMQTDAGGKIIATKPIGVAKCCNHPAAVATKCQRQRTTTTMKAATASN